jgi:hypothetical protein
VLSADVCTTSIFHVLGAYSRIYLAICYLIRKYSLLPCHTTWDHYVAYAGTQPFEFCTRYAGPDREREVSVEGSYDRGLTTVQSTRWLRKEVFPIAITIALTISPVYIVVVVVLASCVLVVDLGGSACFCLVGFVLVVYCAFRFWLLLYCWLYGSRTTVMGLV